MKLMTKRVVDPPNGADVGALLGICRRLEELHGQHNEASRWLARLDRTERLAAGELERAEKRYKAGDRTLDPHEIADYFKRCQADAKAQREKVDSAVDEINRLERELTGNPQTMPTLEGELVRLQGEEQKAQRGFEMLVLAQLAGRKLNGDMTEARAGLHAAKAQMQSAKIAIDLVRGLIADKERRAAVKAALPSIEAAATKLCEDLDHAAKVGEEAAAVLARLKKEFGYDLPGGWPAGDFERTREQIGRALQLLRQEA